MLSQGIEDLRLLLKLRLVLRVHLTPPATRTLSRERLRPPRSLKHSATSTRVTMLSLNQNQSTTRLQLVVPQPRANLLTPLSASFTTRTAPSSRHKIMNTMKRTSRDLRPELLLRIFSTMASLLNLPSKATAARLKYWGLATRTTIPGTHPQARRIYGKGTMNPDWSHRPSRRRMAHGRVRSMARSAAPEFARNEGDSSATSAYKTSAQSWKRKRHSVIYRDQGPG